MGNKKPLYPHVPERRKGPPTVRTHLPLEATSSPEALEEYGKKIMSTPRMQRIIKKANEVGVEYARCCRELGLDPRFIHQGIDKAPSYDRYYKKAQELTELHKREV